ncbi:alcohol oxidase 1 [Rhypophila decipiens]|uniref:Alcohol oxidase 1 n=1 Tax=Rhypophila decipiens TaxID=261697 RepID=A0AAN6YFY9_9PEZI|nr:alcohol oxidase 1 [Rhypophila decipiens]
MSPLPEEFDIIVCGGGSCGCVVAGRLANLDHNLKVLLIEAGENNLNNPLVFTPAIFPRNMRLDSKTATFYESRPSEHLAGRAAVVPAAHVLGGGSSINFMMYTRASASDYDDFQAEGWKTEQLIPLMKKHETYQRASHNRETHGFEGPIKVSFGNYTYPITHDFLRAAESQGIPVVDDLQDLKTGHGAEHWLKWINRDTGRRSDSAHGYIHSTRAVHSNLYLACNTKVDKIILDENNRAVAVQTVPTRPIGDDKGVRIFRARKQIVVSGGTMSSPLILQRSGIGDAEKLRRAGVKPLVDLPGVGLNFQDHYLTFSVFRAKPGTESFDDFARGDPEVQKRAFDEWNLKGTGKIATNGIDAGAKIRPTEKELSEMSIWPSPAPDFLKGWDSYFKNKPDKPVMHYSVIAGWFGDHMLMPPGNFFTMFHFLEYPFSRGSTHITCADPYAIPDFDSGFMNDSRDFAPMVWGYIKSRETARRMDAYAGEVQNMHPTFEFDSPARAFDLDLEDTYKYALPGAITAGIQHGSWTVPVPPPDEPARRAGIVTSNQKEKRRELKYGENDIRAIEEWVKRHVETTWHCLGTCSMAPKEGNSIVKHGVLDERLNVHGVKGLKVADLSICPDNVGCNTYSTALLIGEKAAVLVAEDLGYSGAALDMKVPDYHAPGEVRLGSRL